MRTIRWSTWILAAAVGGAIGLRLAFFAISVTHVPPTGDEALFTLDARRILHGHFPLVLTGTPYQFPFEAYLKAPFHNLLPTNALGARTIPLILSLLTIGLGLLVLRRQGPLRDTWPGVALMLFPSAYLMTIQTAYCPPGYTSLLFLHAAVLYGLARRPRDGAWHPYYTAGLGLLAGFMTAVYSWGFPLLILSGLVVCPGAGLKKALKRIPCFIFCAAIGLAPFWLAKWLIPGSYQAVSGIRSWLKGFLAMLYSGLGSALPANLGGYIPVFPGKTTMLDTGPGMAVFVVALWLWLLGIAVGRPLRRRAASGPDRALAFAWAGVSILGLLAFSYYRTSDSALREYLLPVAWCFPFLAAYAYAGSGPWRRLVLGTCTMLLCAWNVAATVQLSGVWKERSFLPETLRLPDVRPAIDLLRQKRITRAYGSFWIAHPLTYLTDEQILCSQPFNERFPGWPLPYKKDVDAATEVAFVLKSYDRSVAYLTPEDLEADLAALGWRAQREDAGGLAVFTDFRRDPANDLEPLPQENWTVSSGDNTGEANRLADGQLSSDWHAGVPQQPGQWIQLEWRPPHRVGKMALSYARYPRERAKALNVLVRVDGAWQPAARAAAPHLSHATIQNGHPVYRQAASDILRWAPVLADGLRIEIQQPAEGRDWRIGEITLFAVPEATIGASGQTP